MRNRSFVMGFMVAAALAACSGDHDHDHDATGQVAAIRDQPVRATKQRITAMAPTPSSEAKESEATPAYAMGSGAGSSAPVPTSASRAQLASAVGRIAAHAADGHKLIRHGELAVTVDALDGARIKLETITEEAGGFVDRSQVDHEDGRAQKATLVLRVPADRFTDVMRNARELGAVDRDESETEDVTDEYTDLAARLANTKRLEQRLLQLVDTRAGNMSEVLEVENQIADVRGTIEQMEGRIRVWDDQVTLSRITVELDAKRPAAPPAVAKVEPAPPAPPAPPTWWDKVSAAGTRSLDALAGGGTAVAMGVAAALPWLPFLLLGLLLARALGRRAARALRVRRMRAAATTAADADVTARAAVAAAQAAGIAAALEVHAAVD